jgi:sodium/potassium-transporting ATPase subunit alpha
MFQCNSGVSSMPLPTLPSDDYHQEDYVLLVKGVSYVIISLQSHSQDRFYLLQAPDILMRRCSQLIHPNGEISPLRDEDVATISAIQESFALRGQRVLLLAKKIIPAIELGKSAIEDSNRLEDQLLALNIDLSIVGLVALVDPPRDDTADTVRVCRGAGVRFVMVTGTSVATI